MNRQVFGGLTDADRLALVRQAEVMRPRASVRKLRPRRVLVSAQPMRNAGEFPGVDIDVVHRNWGVTTGIAKKWRAA